MKLESKIHNISANEWYVFRVLSEPVTQFLQLAVLSRLAIAM